MDWHAWLSLGLTVGVIGLLAATSLAPDLVFMAALAVLLVAGVVTPKEAFAGFSNEGMLSVALLYVVVAGVRETGAMTLLGKSMFGKPKSVTHAQLRVMVPTALASGVVQNTPLVAMLLPALSDWCKKHQVSPSRVMLPLSYASILGGCTTLIGTSTNVIVNGLMKKEGMAPLGMWTITPLGVPLMFIGIGLTILLCRFFLPDRHPPVSFSDDARQYTLEMLVDPQGPLVGKTIDEAGLRNLPGSFLAEVDRGSQIIPAVGPHLILEGNDRLIFVGVVDSVLDLQKIRGLIPAADQVFKLDAPRRQRILVEAVVSDSCPAVGHTIRDSKFRNMYQAVVIAVARNGERLAQKIGDIVLKPGDTLLLEARPSFAHQQRNSRDFYLVSQVENSEPPRHERWWVALLILGGLITAVSFEAIDILTGALLAGGAMIAFRCCSPASARKSIDWPLLITIAASFGLGTALTKTGAAKAVAESMTALAGTNPWLNLVVIYVIAMVFTELLSNNAAAALMFPIAVALAAHLGVSPIPYVIAIMFAASFGFATPVGYQTHLMVFGPGGYRFGDFFRVGLLLDITLGAIACALIPVFFRF